MADLSLISKINATIKRFFDENPDVQRIAAKELMPYFIEDKVFTYNHRDGLPIREVLRDLDRQNRLNLIPYVVPERKTRNTYWFFIRLSEK